MGIGFSGSRHRERGAIVSGDQSVEHAGPGNKFPAGGRAEAGSQLPNGWELCRPAAALLTARVSERKRTLRLGP